MSEMAERIAQAWVAAQDMTTRDIAVVMLKAMREPTHDMLVAGATWGTLELDGALGRDFTGLWQAMIDAALI